MEDTMNQTIVELEKIEDDGGLNTQQKIELANQYKLKPKFSKEIDIKFVSQAIDSMLDQFSELTLRGQIRVILNLNELCSLDNRRTS
jgi:hypothetical protein